MVINRDLAVELKKAGWNSKSFDYDAHYERDVYDIDDKAFVCPTLEELITTCGYQLEAIIHQKSHAGDEWIAVPFYGDRKRGHGATPIEAVARFYVANHPYLKK